MRFLGYAYMERNQKNGFWHETRKFYRKKIQKAWDWRQEIFQKKFFLESENTKL